MSDAPRAVERRSGWVLMLNHRRALLVLLGALCVALGIVLGLVRFVVPERAPATLSPPPPATAPLTHHLAFVVVDGLRHDVATDPVRMPHFAQRMRKHASGEIWAGPVSMTSAAVLTYGTGQRGGLDQIVNNETGSRVAYNHLIENARAAGLSTFGIGDHAWFFLYRDAWTIARPDPSGVAIDVDYNHLTFAAAEEARTSVPRPNLLVVHFVTPDHQAHAYGVTSKRYQDHLLDFDGKLDAFLGTLPDDTSVIVTSDHGATHTGTHGSDTPEQRRSPFFAYGPGVVARAPGEDRLEQRDLASTFAALLGVSAPAHGRGHVLVDWLAVPEDARARIACADLQRLATFARASDVPGEIVARAVGTDCGSDVAARTKITNARIAARTLDEALGSARSGGRIGAWLVPLLALLGASMVAGWSLGRRTSARFLKAPMLLALVAGTIVAVLLTRHVERLPGIQPIAVRATLLTLGNLIVLMGVVRHTRAVEWLDERGAVAASLVPGLLLLTPSRSTQVESYVLVAVLGLLAVTERLGLRSSDGPPRRLRGRPIVALVALLVVLAPCALQENLGLPGRLVQAPLVPAVVALAVLAAERAAREIELKRTDPRVTYGLAFLGALVAVLSLLGRRHAPPTWCMMAWLGLPLVAAIAWASGKRALAELLAFAAYAWVSREFDVPVLAAVVLVASTFGNAIARRDEGAPPPSLVLLSVTFGFGLVYFVRIGIENGIDFTQLDWGAGAFRDPKASVLRIGLALLWKHGFAVAAVLHAMVLPWSQSLRRHVVRGLVAAELLRAGFLAVILSMCADSFWTALRVIGDIPHALIASVVTATVLALLPRGRTDASTLTAARPVAAADAAE